MNREEIKKVVLNIPNKYILLELATGIGKTMLSLSLIDNKIKEGNILIVVPKLVLIDGWKKEISKWYPNNKWNITLCTYRSFHKYSGRNWDYVIFDEVQHLSERCIDVCCSGKYRYVTLLSATVKKGKLDMLRAVFRNLYIFKISAREAMNENILPDPKVYLIPLELNNTETNCVYIKNKKNTKVAICEYKDRMKYWYIKGYQLRIKCTQQQYINILDNEINRLKQNYYNSRLDYMKNMWLQKCNERLKFLSSLKTEICNSILDILDDKRTLTFCSSIAQTTHLGKYCINSKNKKSDLYLRMFNEHRINHITACAMLDEGVNLVDCQYGIYGNLNSSETIIVQRLGRILRHKEPIIIIPYFKNTRDEEIVLKMTENYNKDLIKIVDNFNKLN